MGTDFIRENCLSMSKPVSYTSAVTFIPTSYSDNTFGSNYYQNLDNGLNPHDGTNNYARFRMYNTGYSIYYDFSVIDIPSIATINSVSCQVRGYVTNASYYPSVQLYSNTTAKGSATNITSTSTSNVISLTTGTWTLSELQNVRLYIKTENATTRQTRYFYFYGATLTVNYTVDGIEYEINASSETSLATIEPSSQEIFQGESGIVKIETDNVGDIVVEDNGVDVTDQLVVKQKITSGTTSNLALTNTTTGVSSTATSFYMSSSNEGYTYINLAGGYGAEDPNSSLPTGTSTGNYVYVKDNGNNDTTGWIIYSFDFSSIPSNATITSMEVKCYGAKEEAGTSNSQHVAKIGLYSDNTLKSTEQEFTSSSNQLITINNPGTWSRDELQNAKLRFTVGYYGGRLGGITWTVNYSTPVEGNPYYYEYTVNNISADHEIVVSENVIIPPEEESGKTYYPITISSINATTNPGKGTTRVESGTSETITITPSNPQLTLALDNGVDVTSQLVAHGGDSPTSALTAIQGASYGFAYCGTTGYYMSQNKGVDKSAAVCKIDFDLPVRCLVTIEFINYAEATYDFGVFGNIDMPLSTDYYAAGSGGATITDNSYKLACNTSAYNTSSPQTITYEIESGQHSIYVKYSKDDATSENSDALQFRITNIEALEPIIGYYTYDLNNINQSHSLIFIFGDVTYYFVTSNTSSDAKLYPNGQTVQLPGDTYKLVIVPENTGDTITVRDNNIDVTGSLVKKEETVQKEGSAVTVVNYIYTLSNIQTGHTIIVASETGGVLYVKTDTGWTGARRIWKKNSKDEWAEQTDLANIFETNKIYIRRSRP